MDRILIRKFKPVEKTASGIYIPEKAQEAMNRGEVVSVGPGSSDHQVTLKAGDQVILPNFGGTSVKLNNSSENQEELYLYRESEILGKIVD